MKARYWALLDCERVRTGSTGDGDHDQTTAASMEVRIVNVRYIVELSAEERELVEAVVADRTTGPRKRCRAQILLACDRAVADVAIAETLPCGTSTIYRAKKRLVEEGLDAALSELPRKGGPRKLTGKEEATLVALACSKPPPGSGRWTLQLLADHLVCLVDHDSLSKETIRRRLAENELKPWRRKMWCIPSVDAEFVMRMENVLDLYGERANRKRPVISFDETPIQLIGETRVPIPAAPGRLHRFDYEYSRNGTANLFVFVDAHRPWRHVKVTERRTAIDFAECMRDLVDIHYPHASVIRVVMDNLSTHRAKNLYEAFAPEEARRILRRLEFHFTPKHASWLNMVEIEISVLSRQCLNRRIPDAKTLGREIAAWQRRRDATGARIKWMFNVTDARRKLGRSYPAATKAPKRKAA
jgi:transposase